MGTIPTARAENKPAWFSGMGRRPYMVLRPDNEKLIETWAIFTKRINFEKLLIQYYDDIV